VHSEPLGSESFFIDAESGEASTQSVAQDFLPRQDRLSKAHNKGGYWVFLTKPRKVKIEKTAPGQRHSKAFR
jgi:hypothetical protein